MMKMNNNNNINNNIDGGNTNDYKIMYTSSDEIKQ